MQPLVEANVVDDAKDGAESEECPVSGAIGAG